MDREVIIKKIKRKFLTNKTNIYQNLYKKYLEMFNLLRDCVDPEDLRPTTLPIRKYQLGTMDFVKGWFETFEKLGINYFLVGGNLLGAYRNGHFIPWDDDFDIGMMREDYEKLRKYLKENLPELDINDAKLSLSNKYLIRKNYIENTKNEIFFTEGPLYLTIFRGEDFVNEKFLEIFPYDYYKDDYSVEEHRLYADKIKEKIRKLDSFGKIKEFLKSERMNNPNIVEKSNTIFTSIDNSDILRVPSRIFLEEKDMFPLKQIVFEGVKCYAPNNIEKFLYMSYGDSYKKMPSNFIVENQLGYRRKIVKREEISKRAINSKDREVIIKKIIRKIKLKRNSELIKQGFNNRDREVIIKKINRKIKLNKRSIFFNLYKKYKSQYDMLASTANPEKLKPCPIKRYREYQLKIIDFAKEMTDFFDKLGLEYFIHSGTLIGALRHGFVVPWDDDFDTGMMRQDYERIRKLFYEDDRFVVIDDIRVGDNFYKDLDNCIRSNQGKYVCYIGPIYMQIYKGTDLINSVAVDIFPHEYYSDELTLDEYKKITDNIKKDLNSLKSKKEKRLFLRKKAKECSYVAEKSDKIYYGLDGMGSYVVKHKKFMKYSTIFPRKKVMLDGCEFYAPHDPVDYITVAYEDYMYLPPSISVFPDYKARLAALKK